MKTSKYLKTIAFCALMLAAAMPGKAQVFPNTYINIQRRKSSKRFPS